MKPGFKPKAWTKKEWLDAKPPDKVKGSGVEEALDKWQKYCLKKFADMTWDDAAKAQATANALSKAMTTASKKCDPKDKDTLAAILYYKKRADDFSMFSKLCMEANKKRAAYEAGLRNVTQLLADKEAFAVFEIYAKKKAFIWEVVHSHMLCKSKKYEEAVKLYSKDNDYNIPGPMNEILIDNFVKKIRQDQKDVIEAIKSLESNVDPSSQMLSDSRHYALPSGYPSLPEWKALLNKKFPIKEYAVT